MGSPSIDAAELHRIHDEVRQRLFSSGSMSPERPDLGDRYRVVRPLGRGAAGVVWEVEHAGTGRVLAAKVLTLDQSFGGTATERLLLEARGVGSISHPNVVDVIDVGATIDGKPYMVMERLAGRTLEQILADEGPLAWARAQPWLRQIASGLAAAHRIGLVHRDLKPANVMVIDEGTPHERCKVLDFGLARWRRLDDAASRLTRSGAVFGTPSYMSPEQINRSDVDGRTDVYALGCLAYELLTARPPFVGESIAEVLCQQLFEHPSSPFGGRELSSTARGADAWIRRCMRKQPRLRFADMDAAIAGLEGVASGATPVEVPDEALPSASMGSGAPPPRRRVTPWVLGFGISATVIAVLAVTRDGEAERPPVPASASTHGAAVIDPPQAGPAPTHEPRRAAPAMPETPAAAVAQVVPPFEALASEPLPSPSTSRKRHARARPKVSLAEAPPPPVEPPTPADRRVSDWTNPFDSARRRVDQKRSDQPPPR